MNKLKARWQAMPARKKRSALLYTALATITGLVFVAGNADPGKVSTPAVKTSLVNTASNRNLTIESQQAALDAAQRQITSLSAQIEQTNKIVRESRADPDAIGKAVEDALARNRAAQTPPAPTVAAPALPTLESTIPPPLSGGALAPGLGAPLGPVAGPTDPVGKPKGSGFRVISAAQASESEPFVGDSSRPANNGQGSAAKNEKPAAKSIKTYLPPGTILPFVMLSGLNAPTSEAALKNPMPSLLRLRGEAILPNGFTVNLSDCFVTTSAWGQMADERAMMRSEKISCVRSDGKAVEAKMDGYVTGEDGKPGVRGRLVSKTGEVVAQLVKTGVLSTAGNVLTAGAVAYASSKANDRSNTTVSIGGGSGSNAGQVMTQQAATGFNNVIDKIADIYAKYAQDTFPVIEVSPGREGNLQLVNGMTLEYIN